MEGFEQWWEERIKDKQYIGDQEAVHTLCRLAYLAGQRAQRERDAKVAETMTGGYEVEVHACNELATDYDALQQRCERVEGALRQAMDRLDVDNLTMQTFYRECEAALTSTAGEGKVVE